jgi:squalene-hopene/tetraprenyl-beta-curcumene cyclase
MEMLLVFRKDEVSCSHEGVAMKSGVVGMWLVVGGCLGVASWRASVVRGASVSLGASVKAEAGWDKAGAARYLDEREVWWQEWPRAQKDNGTMCISCHTQVPYAMARPVLGGADASEPEKTMMASVETRVTQWGEMTPFYSDAKNGPGKTVEAHATEAVLNAVILVSFDSGLGHLRPVTRTALENAWALQETAGDLAGGWKWQNFHLGPWEGDESGYQGAALLMVEVAGAPGGYAKEGAVRGHLEALREFLRRGYAAQPMVNQLYVLWASEKEPGLLTPEEKRALVAKVRGQQQADGGWRVMAMDERERIDKSPEPMGSDGFATGLAVLAMEESGVGRKDATLVRGVAWLREHQEKDGRWSAASINKERDPKSDAFLFMSDAATGYAVMALERSR